MAADPSGFGPPRWHPHSPQPAVRGLGTLPRAGADVDWGRCAITRTQRRCPDPGAPRTSRWPGPRSARRLVREVVTAPTACAASTSSAPAGTARPSCSTRSPRPCSDAGIAVRRELPGPGEALGPDAALLVDDAHPARPATDPARPAGRRAATATWSSRTARGRGPPGPPRSARRWPCAGRRWCSTCWTAPGWAAGHAAAAASRLRVGPVGRRHSRSRARADRGAPGAGRPAARRAARAGRTDRSRLALPDRSPPGLLAQLGYTVQPWSRACATLLLARALGAPLEAEVLVRCWA